jgi:hypothetical protein
LSYETEEGEHVKTRTVAANDVRIPDPVPGEVVVVERYGRPYAAIIDTDALDMFLRMQAVFGEHVPHEMGVSDLELTVHRLAESGEDTEEFDYAAFLAR